MNRPGTQAPNVLVLMSDQHQASVLGCAGETTVHTPNLDALAERGALLENLYCQAPLCAPSRMSFLTGMLPSQNGVLTNEQIPNPGHPTFAHSAGAAGYRPFLSGKMHALGSDQLLGFVDRKVGDHGSGYPRAGAPPARGALHGAAGPNLSSLHKIGVGRNAYQVRDEFAAEAVISHLRQHDIEQRSTGGAAPFFASVGLMLPHQPYVASADDFQRYAGSVPPPAVPAPPPSTRDHPFYLWWRTATGLDSGVPDQVVEKARTAYWGMVHRLDSIIGTILDTLDQLGMADNTLVVYTSDHGDHLGEHGLWWKQTLLDPAAKVPGIITWPGVIPAGTRARHVAGLVDVCATIVDAVDGPPLPRSVGRSLLPALVGGPWENVTIAEHCADKDQAAGIGRVDVPEPHYQRMVRRDDLKYIDHGAEPAQLFDLATDPGETTNLADDPARSADVAALHTIARDGWDPDQIRQATRTSIDEVAVIGKWAGQTKPPEPYRWIMRSEYNALDEPESSWES